MINANARIERLSSKYVKHVKAKNQDVYFSFSATGQVNLTYKLNYVNTDDSLDLLIHGSTNMAAVCQMNTLTVQDYGYCFDRWVCVGRVPVDHLNTLHKLLACRLRRMYF